MLDGAKEIISEYLKDGGRIALAVSGGMDSMALAHLILSDCKIAKRRILVINVNHKIRGISSDSDSLFVERFCEREGVEFKGVTADVPGIAAAKGHNIEQAARDVRIDAFDSLINTAAVKYVLTAHHAEDNAETVMLNLLRGSGLAGLKGMSVLSRKGILRPLLTTAKSQIEEYVRSNNIPYVTDESNLDNSYSRNFLRNILMPQIYSRWQGFDERLLSLSKEAGEVSEFLTELIEPGSVKNIDENSVFISGAALGCEPVLARLAVKSALKSMGAEHGTERKHIESVAGLIKLSSGSELNIANGLYAVRRYDGVLITSCPPNPVSAEEIPFALKSVKLDGINISVQQADAPDYTDLRNLEGGVLICDMNKIPDDAVWRFKREGDIFTPFGGGTKKLKSYLIDRKIPRRDRSGIPLLASGSVVLAVLGVEISELIKVGAGSKRIILK